jgi:dephospho-CoA kinase
MRALRIGLTGGIASGKSTVARMFGELGVPVIDTDEIARKLVQPGQPALAEIVAAFGPSFLDAAGALDRRRLRDHVFADAAERRRLEAILHPRIEAATMTACAEARGPYQIVVVPLLFETGFERHVDRVLVVDCAEEIQRERLRQRDAAAPEEVDRMLAAQLPRQERLRCADDVITNDGSLEQASADVRRLHGRYLDLARERAKARE